MTKSIKPLHRLARRPRIQTFPRARALVMPAHPAPSPPQKATVPIQPKSFAIQAAPRPRQRCKRAGLPSDARRALRLCRATVAGACRAPAAAKRRATDKKAQPALFRWSAPPPNSRRSRRYSGGSTHSRGMSDVSPFLPSFRRPPASRGCAFMYTVRRVSDVLAVRGRACDSWRVGD